MFFAAYAQQRHADRARPSLAASMSHYLIQQLATQANVRIETHAQVVAIDGEAHVEAIEIEDRRTGERRRVATDAVFVFIGADAETDWLPERMIRDERRLRLHRTRRHGPARALTSACGRSDAIRTCWRPASPACSPRATCAMARSSASRRAWAKAAWRSPSSIRFSPRTRRRRRARASRRASQGGLLLRGQRAKRAWGSSSSPVTSSCSGAPSESCSRGSRPGSRRSRPCRRQAPSSASARDLARARRDTPSRRSSPRT